MAEAPEVLKGHFLLDSGQLAGSFFHRTVLLICRHSRDEGAFGLVLNKATSNSAGDALVAELPAAIRQQPLFLGGPVQTTALSYLYTEGYMPEANVMPNLSLGHALDTLVELGDSFSPSRQLRLFAGYAGWSPGQLEAELARGAWITHPATLTWIFEEEPADMWRSILYEKGGEYRLLSVSPDDLSHN